MVKSFKDILEAAKGAGPVRLVTSFREPDLDLICRAAAAGFIIPCLVGNREVIEKMTERSPLASLEHEIVDERYPDGVLQRAISLIREKRAGILMQGGLDQNAFLSAVLDAKTGLLKKKPASYVSVFELSRKRQTDSCYRYLPE